MEKYIVFAEDDLFLQGVAGRCPEAIEVAAFDSMIDATSFAAASNDSCDGYYYSVIARNI